MVCYATELAAIWHSLHVVVHFVSNVAAIFLSQLLCVKTPLSRDFCESCAIECAISLSVSLGPSFPTTTG